MKIVLRTLLVFAIVGMWASFGLEAVYLSRLKSVQLVRIDHTADNKLGPTTIDVGEPEELILDDPKAFLRNRTPQGLPMADVEYVQRNAGTIVRRSTIQQLTLVVRLGCLLSGLMSAAGLFLFGRLSRLQAILNEEKVNPK